MGYMADVWMQYRNTEGVRWNVSRRRDDRNASLAAGILLAHALRECAGIDERLVTYEKNKAGKPFIKDIQFSISHTEGCVAAAIGSEPCGIDVCESQKDTGQQSLTACIRMRIKNV